MSAMSLILVPVLLVLLQGFECSATGFNAAFEAPKSLNQKFLQTDMSLAYSLD